MRATLLVVAIGVLILPHPAFAQLVGTSDAVSDQPFSIEVNPQYPAPFSTATLSFVSDTLPLTNADMTVTSAGSKLYEGSVRPIGVKVGKAGSVTNVTIVIRSLGKNYRQNVLIQPQDVVLVVEPLSSAPPLYPGKPSIPLEGDARVVAAATLTKVGGQVLNPTTLSYTWSVDGTIVANSSGIGKSAIIVAAPLQYRSRDVSVIVRSQDGTVAGGSAATLDPVEPHVRTYVNDPLLGILFDHAINGSYALQNAEATLYAAPFSLPITNGPPFIRWYLNGDSAQTGPSITLRPSGSGQGTALVSLTATGGGNTTATSEFSVRFGEASGSNFFGL